MTIIHYYEQDRAGALMSISRDSVYVSEQHILNI